MFRGNRHIRKAGAPIIYTEQMRDEWRKCFKDPLYFIENYVRIKNVDTEELVPFKMRGYQKQMLRSCFDHRFVIVKLPRQAGKTVAISAVLLWHVLFIKNFSILIAAHKQDKARDVLAVIKTMFEELPQWLQQGVVDGGWNKGSIILEHGSRIRTSATSTSSARGDTYNMVYIDEMAFIATHIADEFVKSVIPTVSSGTTTKVFITSTPKGFNHFHKMWMDAIQKKSEYKPIEIKWNDVPGRDEKFRKGVIAEFGQNYFDQEYGAEFLGSGMTLISGGKLGSLTGKIPLKEGENYRYFAESQRGRQYLITVDIAEGVGSDYSVAMVFDITKPPYEVVSIYQNNYIAPQNFPTVLRQMGIAFNNAPILVEVNFGSQVANMLHDELEYENTVYTIRKKAFQQVSAGHGTATKIGFNMDRATKRIGCQQLKSLIENDQLIVNDDKAINELHRFSKHKDSYAAEEGNDDLVICMVSFAWLVDQGYIRDLTDETARARIAEMHRERLENEATSFGYREDARPPENDVKVAKPGWLGFDDDPYANQVSEIIAFGSDSGAAGDTSWRDIFRSGR